MKLGIGIATQGEIQAITACSLITAIQSLKQGIQTQMLLAIGCYIHMNRNIIVQQAIDQDCTHLLFIDSDVTFDQFAIQKLIDHNLDIVGGRYNKRILPLTSTVPDITTLSEVPFVPTGFLLINMEVIKKMKKPYFFFDKKNESEDLYFCNKAIALGYKVYCDPEISIGHLGIAMY